MTQTLETMALARVSEAERLETQRFAAAFAGIGGGGGVTKAFPQIAAALGVGVGTVIAKYYKWKKHGAIGLVNAARNPSFAFLRQAALHPDTVEFYRRLCVENGRKSRTAFKKLCRLFFSGEDIPGVTPGSDRCRLPEGWSESNFSRHTPTQFEVKAARQGLRAAAEFRPLVYTTRTEMYFFQELQFDDVWHDVECVLLGRNQRVRPLQLGAMEVLSACLFEWCVKPRIRREDDTRVNLGPNDMLFLLAAIFGRYGHAPRGTRLNFEGGTAVPPDGAIDLIHKLSGGEVRCRIGEAANQPAFAGNYPGVAKGNFRTRALIESFWNLTHNETADRMQFPGQTGANARVNAPEDLHGRGREMDLMLRAMPALPDWVVANLRKPLPEFTEALRAIGEINERMNRRGSLPGVTHGIEGFVEAGFVTTDFDLPGVGVVTRPEFERRLADRSEAEREAILALCKPLARTLSPREVFEPRRAELKRWRREAIALLLYPARRDGVVRVGKDHLVTFEDKDISPEPLRFLAHHFTPGDEFEAVINPMVPDLLFIYDARSAHRGAWLGVLTHWGRVSKADPEAMVRRIGAAAKVQNEMLRPVAQLGDRLARERLAAAEHNAGVLDDHAGNPAQRRAAARAREFAGDVSDLLNGDLTPVETAVEGAVNDDFSAEELLG